MQKTCIVIVGPTASGKTSLSIQLASQFNTEIISADSRQCFRELNIGVAKPSVRQLQEIKHHFINSHSIHDEMNAAIYEKLSLHYAEKIFKTNDVAIVVGGTGLYSKAFCEGLDDMPPGDPIIREKIISDFKKNGIEWLRNEIQQKDPHFFSSGEIQNPQRMMRALEVKQLSGRSITSFKTNPKKERPFNIIKIGLDLPRKELYENINSRVEKMFDEGLMEEARTLFPFRHLNALQTVGYSELFQHFDGEVTARTAKENIQQNTRHYAKRQLTWFRKDEEIHWFHPAETNNILQFANERLTSGKQH